MSKTTTGQIVAYVRVSSTDQNLDRQHSDLAHLKIDRTFTEKMSGKTTDRPELIACLKYLREFDVLVVSSMDRLSRSLPDLLSLVKQLTARKVKVMFVRENLTFTGDDDSLSQLLLSIIGSFAQFELSQRAERQKIGIQLARQAGRYTGRTAALKPAQITEVRALAEQKMPIAQIAAKFAVSRPTIYKAIAAA